MTDGQGRGRDEHVVEIDTSQAHPARMYDFLLGGSTHFDVDRAAVLASVASTVGIDNARADVWANRAFLCRVVRYLARDAGVRQFLDIGCGIPNGVNDTLAVAQHVAPGARVVSVDHDPIVLAHSHALLKGKREGVSAFVAGDLRDPEAIVDRAAETLDLGEPIAVLLVAVLHFFPEEGNPQGLVARLVNELAPASYVALSHMTGDFNPTAMDQLTERLGQASRDPFVLRDRRSVGGFLDGLEVVEPGVVQVDDWFPDPDTPASSGGWVPGFYGAVGYKQ